MLWIEVSNDNEVRHRYIYMFHIRNIGEIQNSNLMLLQLVFESLDL
jgi:hypothetical protein